MLITTLGVCCPEAQTAEQIIENLRDRTARGMVPWQVIGQADDFGVSLPYELAVTITRVKPDDGGTEIVLQVCGKLGRQLFAARYSESPEPAATDPNRFACDDPTIRTVAVEQFCSWSAWSIITRFNARTTSVSSS